MLVTLESHQFGWSFILRAADGRTLLIQTDHDYTGAASNLGWAPCCGSTDGTVNCREHGTLAIDMMSSALEFLRDHEGETFEDPGYFGEDN